MNILISVDGSTAPIRGENQVKSAIGVYIEVFGIENSYCKAFGKKIPAKTNNEAEFEAINASLRVLIKLLSEKTHHCHSVEVVSDSRLTINSINNEYRLSAKNLLSKLRQSRRLIKETIKLCPNIKFVWKRRNSTQGLREANNLAQTTNGLRVR